MTKPLDFFESFLEATAAAKKITRANRLGHRAGVASVGVFIATTLSSHFVTKPPHQVIAVIAGLVTTGILFGICNRSFQQERKFMQEAERAMRRSQNFKKPSKPGHTP